MSNKRKRDKKANDKNPTTNAKPQQNNNADQPWSKSKKKRMRKFMNKASQEEQQQPSHDPKSNNTSNTPKQAHTTEKRKNAISPKNNKKKNLHSVDGKKSNNDGHDNSKPSTHNNIIPSQDSGGGIDKITAKINSKRPKSALQQAFLARLSGSRFRELNEELYTTSSQSALEKFQSSPELFQQYHEGFRTQVKQWPINPVNVILKWIVQLEKRTRKQRNSGKEDHNSNKLVVVDFGCGDAKLASELLKINAVESPSNETKKTKKKKKSTTTTAASSYCPFQIHSFDLVSHNNPLVTACDMADVPLEEDCVDVGIFSLALMGTNVADFIREAHRVLKSDGVIKIAEVRSRFESSIAATSTKDADRTENNNQKGGDNKKKKRKKEQPPPKRPKSDPSLLKEFLNVMKDLGFSNTKMDRSNKMFVLMEFVKTGEEPCRDATFTPKPCIYKRR